MVNAAVHVLEQRLPWLVRWHADSAVIISPACGGNTRRLDDNMTTTAAVVCIDAIIVVVAVELCDMCVGIA